MPDQTHNDVTASVDQPWYRQFWPWFIIALPASAVVAGFITLWLAISNPDGMVVTENEFQRLNHDLKAQTPGQSTTGEANEPEVGTN